ncbi:hypothetical protein CDAR_463021 [Caerostris darwini]|uniref:Uncharacterized protein n=1 Tax=Caerostris darwini TaxID=1538125 RepID=A0AAV4QAP8_9ARAC|nr:hypothetical protein CDAR_463021 [Caerostris darwini]
MLMNVFLGGTTRNSPTAASGGTEEAPPYFNKEQCDRWYLDSQHKCRTTEGFRRMSRRGRLSEFATPFHSPPTSPNPLGLCFSFHVIDRRRPVPRTSNCHLA